jgi:hypothetical protein
MVRDFGVVENGIFLEVETGLFGGGDRFNSEANSVGYKGASVMTCLPASVEADTNEGVL